MITPDQVRGKHKTLEDAVLQNQWPTLAKARGKVVFLMDQRPVGPVYLDGHDSLRGRVKLSEWCCCSLQSGECTN
jgi:hypothetical protein